MRPKTSQKWRTRISKLNLSKITALLKRNKIMDRLGFEWNTYAIICYRLTVLKAI